jgi:hypothetical protein
MIDYYLEPNTLVSEPGKYRAIVTNQESATGEAFVKMAASTLNMSEGEITGILDGLSATAAALIGEGWGLTLPGFGAFSFSMQGVYDGADAPAEDGAHTVALNFRAARALAAAAARAPTRRIHGVVHGPVIDDVVDLVTGAGTDALTPGGNVKIVGRNIKIAGDAPGVGVAFIGAGGAATGVPMAAVSRNMPTELVFICPPLSAGAYRLRVTTQYGSGPTRSVDAPRSYTFGTALTAG